MNARLLYLVGSALGLVGSLVTAGAVALTSRPANAALVLPASLTFAIAIRNTRERTDFDRDHSLGYRILNAGGGLFVIGIGLTLLAIGVGWFATFG